MHQKEAFYAANWFALIGRSVFILLGHQVLAMSFFLIGIGILGIIGYYLIVAAYKIHEPKRVPVLVPLVFITVIHRSLFYFWPQY